MFCHHKVARCPHWGVLPPRRVGSAVPASEGERHPIRVPNEPAKRDGRELSGHHSPISCPKFPSLRPSFSDLRSNRHMRRDARTDRRPKQNQIESSKRIYPDGYNKPRWGQYCVVEHTALSIEPCPFSYSCFRSADFDPQYRISHAPNHIECRPT